MSQLKTRSKSYAEGLYSTTNEYYNVEAFRQDDGSINVYVRDPVSGDRAEENLDNYVDWDLAENDCVLHSTAREPVLPETTEGLERMAEKTLSSSFKGDRVEDLFIVDLQELENYPVYEGDR